MPEITEVRIMSEYVNEKSLDKKFIKAYHVEKGNNPIEFDNISDIKIPFTIESDSFGKELILKLNNILDIHVFMGMSGNWKYVLTSDWQNTKFTRLRFDDTTGHSLILYGGFMGPKYSVGKPFSGVKRGPDPTKQFDIFKDNILSNLNSKVFDKPICEALLNQEYFNGVGNYIRSTILYYANTNPFEIARISILENPAIIELCKEVPLKSYEFHGGQLRDWKNPFDMDSKDFSTWVFYKKGISCKDKTGRTFWFDKKWIEYCPYEIKNKKVIYE